MSKYINYFIIKILSIISPFIKMWESFYIKKYSQMPLKYEPTFIIGAPRTGSTILYQTFTNELDCIYINNLSCKLYKNLFFGLWISSKIYKYKAHNCFNSDLGDTDGLNSPSECGHFWYRWFPSDRHYLNSYDITEKEKFEIRNELTSIINYHNKPLIIKNLGMGQRLKLLKDIFPNAKIIYIDRNPLFTAQSIFKARRKENHPLNNIWSIKPKNYKEIEKLSIHKQIVAQIYFLQKKIVEDIKLFNDFIHISYIDLKDKDKVTKFKDFIFTEKRDSFDEAIIKPTEKLSLEEDDILKFESEIETLNWISYDK